MFLNIFDGKKVLIEQNLLNQQKNFSQLLLYETSNVILSNKQFLSLDKKSWLVIFTQKRLEMETRLNDSETFMADFLTGFLTLMIIDHVFGDGGDDLIMQIEYWYWWKDGIV